MLKRNCMTKNSKYLGLKIRFVAINKLEFTFVKQIKGSK